MSSILAPFGLMPVQHPSGVIRPKALDIASGYNTNLFQYTPVALNPAGSGLVIFPAVSGPIVGAFQGVEFTPSDGRRRYSNNWPANQVATQIVAYYTDDELIEYVIQANGSIPESDIGNQINVTAEAGNTVTGFSTVAADIATITAVGNGMLAINQNVNTYPIAGSQNAFGDAFTIISVRIANHQFRATRVAF